MPTTLTGLLLFVVLLLPGFAYAVGKERNATGQQLTPFRETAAVVAASVSFELVVLGIFAVIRTLWPSLTPDVGALIRDGRSYLRGGGSQPGHYGQVALWTIGMLAVATVLAYVAHVRDVAREPRHPCRLHPRRRVLCGRLARLV